jgi:hypothetical protein
MQHNHAGQLLDAFQPNEIQSVLSALTKLNDAPNLGEQFKAYTNGFQPTDLIYPFIKHKVLSRLETLLDRPINLVHGMLLKEKKPWGIHTDYVKGDLNPDMGILIPLNSLPLDTHTVIFNEICINDFDNYRLTNAKSITNAVDIHDTLMSHETVERLEYVSLLGAYKWYPGSVIYWDRKLLHASDNFLKNNVAEKTALVLFTNFK